MSVGDQMRLTRFKQNIQSIHWILLLTLDITGGQGDGSMNDSSDSDTEDKEDGRRATLKIDDWTMFRLDSDASALIIQLRLKWHSLFLRRMRAPTKLWSQFDESTIRTVVAVLTNEEQALGLQQPAGIGQRPRPMSTETVVSSGGSRRGSATELDQADDAFCAGVGDYPQHSGAQGEYNFKAPRKEGNQCNRLFSDKQFKVINIPPTWT